MNNFFSPDIARAILDILAGALGTALIGGIGYYFAARRGNRIILSQSSTTSLIEISEKVKQNLKIEYKGNSVEKLFLYKFQLFNNGNQDIKDVSLRLIVKFKKEISFLEVQVNDKLNKTIAETPVIDGMGDYPILIYRPFLNSRKKYKEEEISLFVFSNGNLDFELKGGDKGWYSQLNRESKTNEYRFSLISYIFMSLIVILTLISFPIKEINLLEKLNFILLGLVVLITVVTFIRDLIHRK